jgi:hypothetical protein
MLVNPKRKLVCCYGCGRDTFTADGLCIQCCGAVPSHLGKGRGRKAKALRTVPLEDDYSEDSDADSGAVWGWGDSW